VLFDPRAHERLTDAAWDAERVREAIRAIAADAEDAFEQGWVAHPLDEEGDAKLRNVYLGGAGVIEALRRLRERGLTDGGRDYVPYLEWALEQPPEEPDGRSSLMIGETGIRLVLERLRPSAANREAIAELIASNARDVRRELMWGSPGTMLAARELGLDDLWEESAQWLRSERREDGTWEQDLYGQRSRYLGPVHGWAGCVLALGGDPLAAEVARRQAVREGPLANWPPSADGSLSANDTIRVQWCHGAPGIVATLGDHLDEDLAIAGGELTWRAGPLVKGANLCHGTAGNGYAFLTLHARTGDERWLARARAFAVHAAEQVERGRARFGHGWHSLWTGDLGAALYLADCLDGAGDLPLP
jgi:hypothetical protein